MTHAFTNYSQFRSLPRTKVILPSTRLMGTREVIIETCTPDPHNTATISSGATWGLKMVKRSPDGGIITGFKWFREDGTPVEEGSILQGKMIDNILRLLQK